MEIYKKKSLKILLKDAVSICFLFVLLYPGQEASPAEMQIKNKTLENGLSLICQKDASSSITVIQILIRGGQSAEPEDKQGLAYITTRLALEIPDQTIAQDLMSQASQMSMLCQGDYSLITITSLSENLDKTLNTISQIILNPLFSTIRIDFIKKQMDYRKNMQEDDAINVGRSAALEKFFAGTGYGGAVLGDKESLKAVKRKDIKSFYDTHFNAANIVVAAVSDMEEEDLLRIIENSLSKFSKGKIQDVHPIQGSLPESHDIYIEKDKQQYFISRAFLLPEATAKNYTLSYMVEHLLGKGVNSRLWALRTQKKLAYTVNSMATQMKFGGLLEAYLETDKEKKETALEALRMVLKELYENGITQEELEITKTFSKASFLRDNETKTTRARNLASFEALGLGFTFLDRFSEEIDAITLEEINAFLKEYLDPEKGVEVIVGPEED